MNTLGYFTCVILLSLALADGGVNPCIEQIQHMIIEARQNNSTELSDATKALFLYTGKSLNHIGNYDSCERTHGMKYALLAVLSSGAPLGFEGTCVPDHCTASDLAFLTNRIQEAIDGVLPNP